MLDNQTWNPRSGAFLDSLGHLQNFADRFTGQECGVVTSTILNAAILDSRLYSAPHEFSISQGEKAYLRINAGSKAIQLVNTEVSTTAGARVRTYRGAIYTANGTEIAVFNRNASAPDMSETKVYHSPTFSSIGTMSSTAIISGTTGGGGGTARVGNVSSDSIGAIFPPNGDLLIEIENLSSSSIQASITQFFIEPTK